MTYEYDDGITVAMADPLAEERDRLRRAKRQMEIFAQHNSPPFVFFLEKMPSIGPRILGVMPRREIRHRVHTVWIVLAEQGTDGNACRL